MQMLDLQGGKPIVGLIHFFDRCPRHLADNRHSGAVRYRGRIKKLFLQREKPPFRLHAVGHRLLLIVQRKLQHLQLSAALQGFGFEHFTSQ